MKDKEVIIPIVFCAATLIVGVLTERSLTKRIERLENGASETLGLIKLHLENQHGLKMAEIHSGLTAQQSSNFWFAYQLIKANTNSTSITISNASGPWTNLPNTGI